MNQRTHARLAKRLIDACGGVDEVVREKACRLSYSQLYEARDPTKGYYLRADDIAALEAYCGEPIYSRGMAEERPSGAEAADLLVSALTNTEIAAAFQSLAREALADGVIDEAERKRLNARLDVLEQLLRAMRAVIDGGKA